MYFLKMVLKRLFLSVFAEFAADGPGKVVYRCILLMVLKRLLLCGLLLQVLKWLNLLLFCGDGLVMVELLLFCSDDPVMVDLLFNCCCTGR